MDNISENVKKMVEGANLKFPGNVAIFMAIAKRPTGEINIGFAVFDADRHHLHGDSTYLEMKEFTRKLLIPYTNLAPYRVMHMKNIHELQAQMEMLSNRFMNATYDVILPTDEDIEQAAAALKEKDKVAIMFEVTPDEKRIFIACHFIDEEKPMRAFQMRELRKQHQVLYINGESRHEQEDDAKDLYLPLFFGEQITARRLKLELYGAIYAWMEPLKLVIDDNKELGADVDRD